MAALDTAVTVALDATNTALDGIDGELARVGTVPDEAILALLVAQASLERAQRELRPRKDVRA